MSRERGMALFALGSACFLIGPFPGYAQLVGAEADGITCFLGYALATLVTDRTFKSQRFRRLGNLEREMKKLV